MTPGFRIPPLRSGGLVTTYHCPSKCRHCLYNCSPLRDKNYIKPDSAFNLFSRARSLGASSMHIGGGEPMTNPQGLGYVLEAAVNAGLSIDYLETNSFWYRNQKQACDILLGLKQKGLRTLLISISPFHVEYIPFARVKGVMDACRSVGINIFPWMETFVKDLMRLDSKKKHRFENLLETFGDSYLSDIRARYWIHMGGRALDLFRSLYTPASCDKILADADAGCAPELGDTSHFHMDLNQKFVPGLCAGLGIAVKDLRSPLDPETYPVITRLAADGIRGLYDLAASTHRFSGAGKTYISKCDLCNDIRHFLFSKNLYLNELTPAGYYNRDIS